MDYVDALIKEGVAMKYVDAVDKLNQFIEDLQTYYAVNYAPNYDWDGISRDLWHECIVDFGDWWFFVEPDTEFLNSVLMEHDRG